MVIKSEKVNHKAVIYGLLAGMGIIVFYLVVVSLVQSFSFALFSLNSLKLWILPLAIGFGIQIGLFTSIKHSAMINTQVAGSGGISAGSMVACCSHFLVNIIPLAGLAGVATFLVAYQKVFLGVGILSNAIGISLMMRHKKRMKRGCH